MALTTRPSTADRVDAIGMRVLRIAEEMSSGSRHQGRSERLIEQASKPRSTCAPLSAVANSLPGELL